MSDLQRTGTRLRLKRIANALLVNQRGRPTAPGILHNLPVGSEKLYLAEAGQSFTKQHSATGQALLSEARNRLKAGDLDRKSPDMDAAVDVSGAKTVANLIEAVGRATGVEVYADGRLPALSVRVYADDARPVRARDLLEALCWAVAATFRKVGPAPGNPKDVAYVFSYDCSGLGALRGDIQAWISDGLDVLRADEAFLDGSIRAPDLDKEFSFQKKNRLNPTSEALRRLDDSNTGLSGIVPLSGLTPDQRQMTTTGITAYEAVRPQSAPGKYAGVRADSVYMSLGLTLTYSIPGIGDVAFDDTWSDRLTKRERNDLLKQQRDEDT